MLFFLKIGVIFLLEINLYFKIFFLQLNSIIIVLFTLKLMAHATLVLM
jgi:hypothetical protein